MVKNPPANAGDVGLTLGLGRFSWKEMAKPLEYSCPENSMDRGAWRATVHGATKSDATEHAPHACTQTLEHMHWTYLHCL